MDGFDSKLFHQKRVYAHRPGWPRILARRFYLSRLEDNGLSGYCSLMCMDAVREPLRRRINGQETVLIADGYAWLQYYLSDCDFSAVATIDPDGRRVQWYLDVISEMGVSATGCPWYDDLYLDVVGTPDGWVEIIDGEDLDAALDHGAINQQLHHQAWLTARRLANELESGGFILNSRVEQDRKKLLERPPLLTGNW